MNKIMNRTLFLLAVVITGIVAQSEENEEESGNVRLVMKLVDECSRKDEVSICLKTKAVSFLDKLVRMKDPVPINDYLALARDPAAGNEGQDDKEGPKTESELEATLPRSLEEKSNKLDDLLWDKISTLFSTRTVQFTVPTDVFEGRGDKIKLGKKKGYGVIMMAAMMGGMMMKMAMHKIALIAGKALIVGKIALVLAVILAIKKWGSGGGGGGHPE